MLEYLLTLGVESETAYEILIRSYLSAAREHGTLAPMYLKLTTDLRRGERLGLTVGELERSMSEEKKLIICERK